MKAYKKIRSAIEAVRLIEAQQFQNASLPDIESVGLWSASDKLKQAKDLLLDAEQIFRRLDSYIDTEIYHNPVMKKELSRLDGAKGSAQNASPAKVPAAQVR